MRPIKNFLGYYITDIRTPKCISYIKLGKRWGHI